MFYFLNKKYEKKKKYIYIYLILILIIQGNIIFQNEK